MTYSFLYEFFSNITVSGVFIILVALWFTWMAPFVLSLAFMLFVGNAAHTALAGYLSPEVMNNSFFVFGFWILLLTTMSVFLKLLEPYVYPNGEPESIIDNHYVDNAWPFRLTGLGPLWLCGLFFYVCFH